MAFVRPVSRGSIVVASMFNVSARESAKIGRAPNDTTASAVAANVNVGMMTSSPRSNPMASNASWRAAVPELTATACCADTYTLNSCSNRWTLGPVVSQPERRVSTTSAISSSPIEGA
jgi:hypothetical protein